jgi:hypothetical protein
MAPITRSLKRPASPEEKIQVLVKIEPNASAADLGGGDLGTSNGKPTGRRPKPRVKIEYEEEKLQSNEISTASGAKVGQGKPSGVVHGMDEKPKLIKNKVSGSAAVAVVADLCQKTPPKRGRPTVSSSSTPSKSPRGTPRCAVQRCFIWHLQNKTKQNNWRSRVFWSPGWFGI